MKTTHVTLTHIYLTRIDSQLLEIDIKNHPKIRRGFKLVKIIAHLEQFKN